MSRSSVKGKEIHNRFDGSQSGRFGGHTVHCRLSVGLPKDLDDFLTEQSSALKIGKAEIIRRVLTRERETVMTEEKLVHCPACSGNGYIRNPPGDPDVKGPSVDQCELCDSEGEVPKHLADDWPFK